MKSCCVTSILDTKVSDPAMERNGKTMSSVITVTNLLAIRISSPDDGGLYHMDVNESSKAEKLRSSEFSRLLRPWLGFGLSALSTNGLDEDGGEGSSFH